MMERSEYVERLPLLRYARPVRLTLGRIKSPNLLIRGFVVLLFERCRPSAVRCDVGEQIVSLCDIVEEGRPQQAHRTRILVFSRSRRGYSCMGFRVIVLFSLTFWNFIGMLMVHVISILGLERD